MARSTTAASRRATTGTRPAEPADTGPVNEVLLRGRLAAASTEIPLPSGDIAGVFRVIVERAPDRRRGSTTRVDSIECKAYAADLRRKIARFSPGDVLEVHGTLQRRFFRSGGAAVSRYDVVVTAVTRVARAGAAQRATMAG